MTNKECCIVLTTTSDEEVAKLIAEGLIESDLAACVQVDRVQSFYKYENECRRDDEFRLTIKAKSDNYKDIEDLIKLRHNYRLPQIIKLEIRDGLPEYIQWIHGK